MGHKRLGGYKGQRDAWASFHLFFLVQKNLKCLSDFLSGHFWGGTFFLNLLLFLVFSTVVACSWVFDASL